MTPKPIFILQAIAVCAIVAALSMGCSRNNSSPTPTNPSTPAAPDTTKTTQPTTVPVDSAVSIYVGMGTSLYAVNAQTGKIKWSIGLGNIIYNSPLYYQGMVYATAGSLVYAVDTTGKQQWAIPVGSQRDVEELNGWLYISSASGPPEAVDPKTGNVLWQYPTTNLSVNGFGGPFIISQQVLYFLNGYSLYAINPTNGQLVWIIDNQTNTLPAVTPGKVILAGPNGSEQAFDRGTAQLLWTRPAQTNAYGDYVTQSMNYALGNVYDYEGANLYIVDTATGATKFTINSGGYTTASFSSSDSLLFGSVEGGGIYCYNANTSVGLWSLGMVDNPYSGLQNVFTSVTTVNNQMYYSFDALYARDISTRNLLWQTVLENSDGWSYSVPCVVTKSGKVCRYGTNF